MFLNIVLLCCIICDSYVEELTDDATKNNNVVDSSICSCKEESRTSYGTLWLVNANISILSVNFTDNECYCYPSAMCGNTYARSNQPTARIKFASIISNYANYFSTLTFETTSAIDVMENSNFIRNTQGSAYWALIFTDGPALIQHCTILENDEDTSHKWFLGRTGSGVAGSITIVDCTIDSTYTSHVSGSVNIYFIQPFEGTSFINALKHTVKEGLCEASYDAVGDLTPVFSDFVVCETNNVDIDLKTIDTMRVLEYVFAILLMGPWDYASYINPPSQCASVR